MKTVRNMLGMLAVLAVSIGSVGTARAVTIASESFATQAGGNDYNVDRLRGQNRSVGSTGFSGAWGNNTSANRAANGGLTHAQLTGTALAGHIIGHTSLDGSTRLVHRAINYTPAAGTYYMSALLQNDDALDVQGHSLGLNNSAPGNISVDGSGIAVGINNGNLIFRERNNATTLVADMTEGETFMAVLEILYSETGDSSVNAKAYNASSALVADITVSNIPLFVAGVSQIAHISAFTQGRSGPDTSIDEFRFGTELSDVATITSAVPEPSTVALGLLGMGYFVRRRKRA